MNYFLQMAIITATVFSMAFAIGLGVVLAYELLNWIF